MDKIINLYKVNKRLVLCVLVITIVGIISGSLFITVLSNNDKNTVIESINGFFEDIKSNNLNYGLALRSGLITNIIYLLVIWLLGISVIGIPLILIMFFSKTFIFGFTLVSIIANSGFKGTIYAFLYIFPHQMIDLLVYGFLSLYALIYSSKLIYSFFKKQTIDFKPIMNKYKYILVVSILIVILTSLYHTFVMPNLLKVVLNLLK